MLSFTFYGTIHLDCPVFIWRYTMEEQKIKVLALLPMELPKEIELELRSFGWRGHRQSQTVHYHF